jgi:hypothetical protein
MKTKNTNLSIRINESLKTKIDLYIQQKIIKAISKGDCHKSITASNLIRDLIESFLGEDQ